MKILITEYSDHSGKAEVFPYEITKEQEVLIEWLREHGAEEWRIEEVDAVDK